MIDILSKMARVVRETVGTGTKQEKTLFRPMMRFRPHDDYSTQTVLPVRTDPLSFLT